MFKIWYLRFILNYPTHFHDHGTPKLGLTLQNQYCFSKWYIKGDASAKKQHFCYGAGKGPYGHPTPSTLMQCQTTYLWHVCPGKILTSLHIRTFRSKYLLGTVWIAKGSNAFMRTKNSDQTARMQRVRKVFIDSTCQKVRLSTTGAHFVVSKLFT